MATGSLQLQLTTLTPLWTGGVDGRSDRLHVTGIMGSLRWWYEVFVRSVGGTACDPTEHSCTYDQSKLNYGLCDVCRVFGATGWSRRFKIIVSETGLQQRRPQGSVVRGPGLEFNLSQDHPSNRNPMWRLPSSPLYGQTSLTVTPTVPLDKDDHYLDPHLIGSLIQFIADRASLGAKPQMGMGVIRLANRQSLLPLINHLKEIENRNKPKKNIDERLPCLQNMFFARVLTSSTNVSATFDLKYDLRGMFRGVYKGNDNLRHFIMGTVRGERQGAKIMMSYPYRSGNDTGIRLWGWIPEGVTRFNVTREQVMQQIHSHLHAKYTVNYWREFNTTRDTTGQKYTVLQEYLNSLLEDKHDS